MRFLCILSLLALTSPFAGYGASKEIVQLQRDVALLQDQVRTLQQTLDQKVSALQVLTEQTLDKVNQVNTTVTVLDSSLSDRMKNQEKNLVSPVANLNAKIDSMSSDFQYVQESMKDLSARIAKLEQQINDLSVAMKTLNAPVQPPGEGSPGGPPGAAAAAAPAGMTPKSLYDNAYRDKIGGNLDLAMQEFNDYLRYFGSTDLAPNAQYYVGEVYYNKGDYNSALKAFDTVLERYPENNKTRDAFYMKGMTLVKSGQRTRGAEEFYELIRRYPGDDLARKAKAQLKALGLSPTPSPSKTRKR